MNEQRKFPRLTMDSELKKKYIHSLIDAEYSIFHNSSMTQLFFIAATIGCTNSIKLQSRIRDQFRLVEQLSSDEIAFMDSIAAKYYDFDLDKLEDGSNVVKALEEYANAGAKLLYEQATNSPDKLIFSILGDFRSLSDPNTK